MRTPGHLVCSYPLRVLRLLSLSLTLLAALCVSALIAAAQTATATPPCTLEKQVYTCDGKAFQKQLDAAKSIGLETHTIDRYAQGQLRNLITKKLDKTVVAEGEPADLVFLLIPLEGEGVTVSPSDTERGTFRVYTVGPNNSRGNLIWAEVYTGQGDLPWPTVVNGLISQFRNHFHIR